MDEVLLDERNTILANAKTFSLAFTVKKMVKIRDLEPIQNGEAFVSLVVQKSFLIHSYQSEITNSPLPRAEEHFS